MLDEKDRLQHAAAELKRIADAHQLALWRVAGQIYAALSQLYDGDADAEALFHDSIRAYQVRFGAQHLVAPALRNFANHMLELGEPDRARAAVAVAVADACELIHTTGERCH